MSKEKQEVKEEVQTAEECCAQDQEQQQQQCSCGEDCGASSGAEHEIRCLREALDKKEKDICVLKELMQRRQADFENYKKMNQRENERQKKTAIRNIAVDIMEINDNLIRASEAATHIEGSQSLDEAHKAYVDGVLMVSRSIEAMLGKYGIVEIQAQDCAFDPAIHEAVDIDMSGDVQCDTVTKVYQKGFALEEQVLRSAKVRVTKPLPVQGDSVQE
jgi:molecular chaperone GrpE